MHTLRTLVAAAQVALLTSPAVADLQRPAYTPPAPYVSTAVRRANRLHAEHRLRPLSPGTVKALLGLPAAPAPTPSK